MTRQRLKPIGHHNLFLNFVTVWNLKVTSETYKIFLAIDSTPTESTKMIIFSTASCVCNLHTSMLGLPVYCYQLALCVPYLELSIAMDKINYLFHLGILLHNFLLACFSMTTTNITTDQQKKKKRRK